MHDFEVEKIDGRPTNRILRSKLCRIPIRQERLFARGMPSLRRMFGVKVNDILKPEGETGKAKGDEAQRPSEVAPNVGPAYVAD